MRFPFFGSVRGLFAVERLRRVLTRVSTPLLIVVVFVLTHATVAAQQPEEDNRLAKAVFLVNLTKFVTWPGDAFPHDQAPLVIGIVGEDPFGSFLEEAIKTERASSRPLMIRRYSGVSEVSDCHLLFIGQQDAGLQRTIVDSLQNRPVLTVSDREGFVENGGMIGFRKIEGKLHLQVNPEAAAESGLSISSKLLRLADVVPQNIK